MSPFLSINGRFLAQPSSGVQRYARQIVSAIDAQLPESGVSAEVQLVLTADAESPELHNIKLRTVGSRSGYYWEQVEFPMNVTGPLLNLCNLGPLIRSSQILCIHDANVFTDPQSYSRAFRLAYRTLQPLLVRRVAKLVTVSRFSAGMLAKHLPVGSKDIMILPNGYEHVESWKSERSSILDNRGERPFLLLLGSKAKHKNADLILRLAQELDQHGLDIYLAGGVKNIFAAEEQADYKNIVRLGYVTDDDLAALLGRALCLAFPSWNEGFGLPILEAMALGCPVISSDRASMPEVGGDAVLYAAPDDPGLWLKQILRLQSSQDLRDELVEKGRRQARLFSWRQSAAGYLDLARAL